MATKSITKVKSLRRLKIRRGIRKKIKGTPERPRLSIFRSNNDIYVQVIDDTQGHTLVSASSRDSDIKGLKDKTKVEKSKAVGAKLAQIALEAGITNIVFDRGGYLYHGRVKAVADGAREAGLNF